MLNVERFPSPSFRYLALTRAGQYAARLPAAVSGQGGHNRTFAAAIALVHGFALTESDAWPILLEYNTRCTPPWSDAELRHKLTSAAQITHHSKERGYLLTRPSPGIQIARPRTGVAQPSPDFRGRLGQRRKTVSQTQRQTLKISNLT